MEVRGSRRNVSRFAGIAVVSGAVVALGVAALLPSSPSRTVVVTPAAQVADVTSTTMDAIDPGVALTTPTPAASPVHQSAAVAAQAPAGTATVNDTPTTEAPAQVTAPAAPAVGDLPVTPGPGAGGLPCQDELASFLTPDQGSDQAGTSPAAARAWLANVLGWSADKIAAVEAKVIATGTNHQPECWTA